jgi:opacity protein-like surface antigen
MKRRKFIDGCTTETVPGMRRIFPVFLFIFVLLFSLTSPLLSQRDKVRVTAERANIHVEPDIRSTVAETVENGMLLYLFSSDRIKDRWYRIYFYSDKKKTTVVGYIQISMVGEIVLAPKITEEIKPMEKIADVVYEPPKNLRVIAARAGIRAESDSESRIIQEVSSYTKLLAIGKTGEWYRVNLPPDKEGIILLGYIHENLVEEVVEEIKEIPKIKEIKPKVNSTPRKKIYRPERIETGPMSCIGVSAGYSMPQEDIYSEGINYGANFSFGIVKYLSIEVSGLRFQSDVEGSVAGFSKGKLTVMPVQLSIQARLPVTPRFIPYIQGGGGYYLNSFALDGEIIDTWDALGFDVEEKIESSIGYHFGAGIDFFLTGKIAISADFKYCMVKSKGSWSLTDQISGTVTSGDLENLSLDTMMFGVGLKFCF